ncbi:tetratricopeptide repeat protein [Paraliomyxa miuraensis]|uniref:tetratricopeptide repeat protein n=1 Tax=Paraliomyxa miuraensis TaxID=376150 RepID=UPI0022549003|nr:tetratricopeptide repeat protein [Paraliomyxa miuraensis]MCX4246712.1 tetratricopeptide repeat protein [Paraliomyxa miuraensis]
MRTAVIATAGSVVVVAALVVGADRLGPPPGDAAHVVAAVEVLAPTAASSPPKEEEAPAPVPRAPPLQRSFELEARGDLEGAAKAAQEAVIAADGRDPRLQAAKIAILRGRLEEAEVWLQPLLLADPDDTTVRYDLALVDHHRRNHAEARAGYEAVLEREPSHADARFNLALILRDSAELDDARWQAEELRRLHPADPRVEPLLQSLADVRP